MRVRVCTRASFQISGGGNQSLNVLRLLTDAEVVVVTASKAVMSEEMEATRAADMAAGPF